MFKVGDIVTPNMEYWSVGWEKIKMKIRNITGGERIDVELLVSFSNEYPKDKIITFLKPEHLLLSKPKVAYHPEWL